MSTAKKLVKGSLFRNAEFFLLLGVAFAITPFIVRSLGDRMYGFWVLIGAFMGYYNLMNYGIYAAAARYIARSLGKGDQNEVNDVANTAFFLLALIGAVTLAGTLVSVGVCPFFLSDPAEIALFRKVLLVLGLSTAIGFPLNLFVGILRANVRYDTSALISISKTIVANVAIYHFLSRGHGVVAVALITAATNAAENVAAYLACKAQLPYIKIVLFRYETAQVRAMFDYGWKILVCQVGDILRFQIDSMLIAAVLNASLLTRFSIGVRVVDGFSSLVHSTVSMMVPVFSQYEGRGDYDAIRSGLLKVTKATTLLSAFVGYSVLFYGKAFILRWMGAGFETSYYVTAILCSALMLELPQAPGVQLLYGLSKHDTYAVMNIAAAVLNVILSVLFLQRFGMYGVVMGTAVEVVIFKLFIQPVYICRVIQMPVRTYLVETILVTLLKTAVPLAAYFYLIRGLVEADYLRLTACVALQTVLFIPVAFYFILSAADRRYVLEVYRSGRSA